MSGIASAPESSIKNEDSHRKSVESGGSKEPSD